MVSYEFPSCIQLSDLFESYHWTTRDPGNLYRRPNKVWISLNQTKLRKNERVLLYGKPKPQLQTWINEVFEPMRSGYVEFVERDNQLIVKWTANHIIASRYLANMPISELSTITW